ncbi:hypothetical protein SEUCBS140593_008561 [Sporothrix eucalyptigena]|uniref:Uncharacterized protein n=1 Tax=Sporothrix eucalyptigena TaxID=1812306 RepID=A0ABP0CMF4_9PEZI
MGPEARLVAEYQRLEEEEAAARAIEEAVSRHRRIRKQRESVRLRGVAMLRKVEEELFDEDKARWEEEERQAAQQATPDVPSTLGLASASLLLEHLVMHEGIYAYRRASLCKLLDPLRLISLRVYNDKLHDDEVMTLIDPYPSREWDQACGIPFDVFGPKGSPHLRQFTIARLEFDVYDMLRRAGTENPAWTRKLAVFCGRFISGFEFPGLLRRGVHFRMLNLDLERTYFHKVPLCDDDSGEELPIEKIPSVEQVLQELVKGDNGTLEGLSIRMADSKLPHHGKLPSLENTQLLATYLAQLSGLAQLDVMHTWVEKAETEAKEIAHLLAEAAPALQYIRNPYAAWRVYREPADGTGDEARAVVRLEPLDEAEIDDIELFKYSIWDPYYG